MALKNLRNSDMITVDSDGFISLTEAGHKISDTIFERHTDTWFREIQIMSNINGSYRPFVLFQN